MDTITIIKDDEFKALLKSCEEPNNEFNFNKFFSDLTIKIKGEKLKEKLSSPQETYVNKPE